jgi:alpha-mannosidase
MLTTRIAPAKYAASVPLDIEVWHVPDEPVPVAEALAADYEPFASGQRWGAPWSTSWFRVRGAVPKEWQGRKVEAVIDLGFTQAQAGFQAEALVYDLKGIPIKGIAPRNNHVPLTDDIVGLMVEAAANPDVLRGGMQPTPLGDKETAGKDPLYVFAGADVKLLDEEVWHLELDVEVLGQLMAELSISDPRRHEILRALERAMDEIDVQNVSGTAAAARAQLVDVLNKPAHASAHKLSAVGHAHIDSAWLWPQRETIRKTSRTFATVTALNADYPEFVFACSQAQQYAWVKDNQPAIFERIAAAVKSGQWAPVGGMWVESDANLPGGEALARQLIHGKRFFLDEFGYECEEVWLPDSFGYTAAFPQLARLAGAKWFLTQKMSWNQTNKMPHHTFWWEGIDGSRVFTHMPPVETYNSEFSGKEMAFAVANFAEKGRATRSLVPFGYGDGGGGPTREMLERARRLKNLEGTARVEIERPSEFFAAAQAEYPDAPVWSGEMYLELHRATYTSQARTKAGNRRSEHLLREAELWAATAAASGSFDYPYEAFDRLWKVVLLHQFHDILPGSSIAWVHKEAEATYARVAAELNAITDNAIASLAGEPTRTLVFNTSPHARKEVVDGVLTAVPASGAAEVEAQVVDPVKVTDRVLDNGVVRVLFDDNGLMTSVRDLVADREVLAGPGNLLQLHPDLPNFWDAWDIDAHYKRRHVDLVDVDTITPVDRGIRIERSFGSSRITQVVSLRPGSARVDVHTEIDWHEEEKILKAAFPLDVYAERSAAEIQFGHVYRPTHTNTSWEAARFEIYAHRWIHVAETGYGVAVLNDSTYGHDVSRNGTTTTVRLSVVRAPRCPDPYADQGRHVLTYSLLPGASIADTVAEGYALNLPVRVTQGTTPPAPLVTVDGDGVTVEAVKLADDRSGHVIVRLYESLGGRTAALVRTSFPITGAEVTDLLERPISAAEVTTDGVPLRLRPFQVVTLRLRK